MRISSSAPTASRILYYIESEDSNFLAFKDSDIGVFSDYDDFEDEDYEEDLEDSIDGLRTGSIAKSKPVLGHDDDDYDSGR